MIDVGDVVESAVKALTKLVRLIIVLRPALAGDHDTRRSHPGETGEPDQLPAHAHSCVG
jgi:hypothetical protein